MKKFTLPIIILAIGIIVVLVGAFLKVQELNSNAVLIVGLCLEVLAIVVFLVKYFSTKK